MFVFEYFIKKNKNDTPTIKTIIIITITIIILTHQPFDPKKKKTDEIPKQNIFIILYCKNGYICLSAYMRR